MNPQFDPLALLAAQGPLMNRGRSLVQRLQLYSFAIEEVRTKLEILRQEISLAEDYNPIEDLSHRVKTPQSIMEKLRRRGLPVTLASMDEHLDDVAGIRVTCSFIADTYRLYSMLEAQPDLRTITVKDYIAEPKPNGYRGLHAIMEVPVHLSTGVRPVRVELQFRTIAMHFWASLEHKIYYKYDSDVPPELLAELADAATSANQLDARMQALHRQIRGGSVPAQ